MTRTANDHPLLTAVVYAHEGEALLRRKLEALCAQTLSCDAFDAVVVDDGAAPDAAEVVRAFDRTLQITHSRAQRPGRLAARNHGVLLARGELVLFLDDDAVPAPGLLEAHCAAHRRAPFVGSAILGATELAPSAAADPLVQFVAEVEGFPVPTRDLRDGDRLEFTSFWAARASCKRALLAAHEPFRTDLDPASADVELGHRLSRSGLALTWCPRAVSKRIAPMDFEAHRLERHQLGAGRRELARSHPEDAAVQRWADVADAAALWRRVAPAYGALVRSARELDRIVRLRGEAQLAVDPSELSLLHRAYWAVFGATTARGVVEGARVAPERVAPADHPPVRP